MNKVRAILILAATMLLPGTSAFAIIIRGGQQIQIQGNGVLLFNSPTVINELPDVSVPSANSSDSLVFSNGDFLYGKLLGIGPQHDIRWQHPDAQQPVEFKTTNVTQIDLSNAGSRASAETNNCKVDFVNNDNIRGNLVSCDAQSVVLGTTFAGQLHLSRALLESLVIVPPPQPALFEGPTGLEGWTPGKSVAMAAGDSGQWSFRNGAFYATKAASIARDVHLPDVAQIEFDVVWKGMLHMAIAMYTDSLQPVPLASKETGPDFGGFYSFQVNSSYMDMMPIKKRDPLKSLGAIAVPVLMQRDRAHFDLRISKPDKKIALLINGVLVKEWIDSDGFAGEGTGMRFVHQGQQSAIKLSSLRIRPWDGQLELPTPPPANRPMDSVRLSDGTRLVGKIQTIANGNLAIATESSTVQLDTSKLRQIDFASQSLVKSQTNAQPVKMLLSPGYVISGDLKTWDPNAVTLSSPAFGIATFDPHAISRVHFLRD
jgi:hypothetical protein